MPVERTTSLPVCDSMSTMRSSLSEGSCFNDRQIQLNKSMYELLHSENIYIYYLQDLLDITDGAAHDNILMMMELHQKFLNSLQEALKDTSLVKRLSEMNDRMHSSHFDFNSLDACAEIDEVDLSCVFTLFIPFLKIYTQYIKEFYPTLSQVKTDCQLYIMPIQRMMRYNLMISQIYQNSLPHFQPKLKACLLQIQSVLNGINQSVHDSEALEQLVYYQKNTQHLPEALVQPHQILKLQSTVYRISKISKDKRILLVLQDKIVWLKQVAGNKFAFRGQLKYPLKLSQGDYSIDGPSKGHYPLYFICPTDQVTTLHQLQGSMVKYTFYSESFEQSEQIFKSIGACNKSFDEFVQ